MTPNFATLTALAQERGKYIQTRDDVCDDPYLNPDTAVWLEQATPDVILAFVARIKNLESQVKDVNGPPPCPRCGELTKKAAHWHQRMLAAKSRMTILVQGLAAANKLYGELSDELAGRAQRIQQLEAALKKYGRHLPHSLEEPGCFNSGKCACGLDPALRGTPNG